LGANEPGYIVTVATSRMSDLRQGGSARMGTIALIDVDPQLGAELADDQREVARRALIAATSTIATGSWEEPPAGYGPGNAYGVLVVDGFMLRTVTIGERTTAQLFGPGDIMQSWPGEDLPSPVSVEVTWAAVSPAVLARLDDRVIGIAGRWPSVLRRLAWRSSSVAGRVSLQVAIARVPRLEERLLLLFWGLAERWGAMTPNGMLLPIGLTHESIAALTAASRPPVSGALSHLSRDGLLCRVPDGWLLTKQGEDRLKEALDRPDETLHEVRTAA
jgi:hypothetical protein